MILHFLIDDIFADYAINQFSADWGQSRFVLISHTLDLHCVKSKNAFDVISPVSVEFDTLLKSLGKYKAIILHGMFDSWHERIISNVPDYVKVAWVFWGGEVYGRRDLNDVFVAPYSKFLLYVHQLKNKLMGKSSKDGYFVPLKCFERIDYCLTSIREEYEWVKSYMGSARFEHLWYTYYSVEETIGVLASCRANGQNILVGNSCNIEGNYLETYCRIVKLNRGSRIIVSPLSYGDAWLKRLLLRLGKLCFGQYFSPMLTFVPRDEYNRALLKCNTMIMPHYRQQAQGNIITGLWLGMRVYLSEMSVTYKFFKRIGAVVYSVESDLNKENPDVFAPMSEQDVQHNREVLMHAYGYQANEQRIKQLVEILNQ